VFSKAEKFPADAERDADKRDSGHDHEKYLQTEQGPASQGPQGGIRDGCDGKRRELAGEQQHLLGKV
jgi:hypothetical protein